MKQITLILLGLGVVASSLAIDSTKLLSALSYKNESIVKSLLLNLSLLSTLLVFFAVVSIRSEVVYEYWWRFTKYAAPICFALIIAINFGVLHTGTTGSFGLGDMLNQTYDLWTLGLIYIVFTTGSLVQIFRGYQAGRRGVAV